MDATIAGILAVDGLTNGAIYALLALALVMVFAVTRVIFIPQGEFVAFAALTLALAPFQLHPDAPRQARQYERQGAENQSGAEAAEQQGLPDHAHLVFEPVQG